MSAALLYLGDEFGRLRRLLPCVTMCATSEVIDPHALAELGLTLEERAAEIAERLARLTKTEGQSDALD